MNNTTNIEGNINVSVRDKSVINYSLVATNLFYNSPSSTRVMVKSLNKRRDWPGNWWYLFKESRKHDDRFVANKIWPIIRALGIRSLLSISRDGICSLIGFAVLRIVSFSLTSHFATIFPKMFKLQSGSGKQIKSIRSISSHILRIQYLHNDLLFRFVISCIDTVSPC